jgi:hypothetical protein
VVPNSDGIDARADAGAIASRLASPDAIERQTAAEALATLAAVNQKKLLEGYRVQEKNKRVRLALDWALYRIGKSEAFFQIVRELDSGRHDQAVGYLSQLDSPEALHDLLRRDTNEPRITTGALQALARIGNAESLDLIKPFRDSFARGVSSAAETAIDAIEARLARGEASLPSRPRTVSKSEESPSP